MQPFLKIVFLLFFAQLFGFVSAQNKLTKEELADVTKQAERQVLFFFDVVAQLGKNEIREETKNNAIDMVVKTFTPGGSVEERGKKSKIGKIRGVRNYLEVIKLRGENRKTLISYDIIDNITPNELKPYISADGNSITYKGNITVRQYYCTLKEEDKLTDKLSKNCKYDDTTDKKIYIEIRTLKDTQRRNMAFAVLINKVVVLSVK